MRDIKLFAGSSNPKLAAEIAEKMGIPLSKSTVTVFGNSEIKVLIEEDVRNSTCIVIQPTSNPTNDSLMELAFFCDALRREDAKKVIGIVPYFGYAKQNIQHVPGECVSVNVVVRFFESLGFHKIYTLDLHDEAIAGVFSIPFKNMSAFPVLAQEVKTYFEKNNVNIDDIMLVSPDQGAVEKVRNFGKAFYGTDDFHEAVIEKKRNQYAVDQTKTLDLYGDVKDKIALIVDDMIVSGGTLIHAVDLCLERGAKKVYTAVVHHDFKKGAPELLQNSHIEKLFATNTIYLKDEQKIPKLIEISIAPLIAEALKNTL